MKIEVGKSYRTKSGHKARVLCIDHSGADYPVVALVAMITSKIYNEPIEEIKNYLIDGRYSANSTSVLDLVALWSNFKPGQLVWVKSTEDTPEYLRIFEKIASNGDFLVADGCITQGFKHCRAVTVEDLK